MGSVSKGFNTLVDWRKYRVKDNSECLYLSTLESCGMMDEDREVEEGSWFDWRWGMVRVRLKGMIIYIVLPW